MPEPQHAVAGIAEDVGRRDQPHAERDFGHLLPALQCNIFKLRQAEHQDADSERIEDNETALRIDDLAVRLHGKPWRQHDQHAKQHAEPVLPCPMSFEETKVRHVNLPSKRHTSAAGEHDTPTVRRPNRPHRGRMSG